MTRLRWLAVVVALQVAVLLGWAGYHEWIRTNAPTILLETRPVDPRDLLRGDYMILAYVIGTVPLPNDPNQTVTPGREIWVTLRPAGRFHAVAAAAWTRPETGSDAIVVRGRVHSTSARGEVRVDYGIEKFFVPEGMGQPQFREMVVEATVSPGQQLGIKRVLLDGRPYPP